MPVLHVYISRRHVRWIPRHCYCPLYVHTLEASHTIFRRPCTLQVSLRGPELLDAPSTGPVLPLLALLQSSTLAFWNTIAYV